MPLPESSIRAQIAVYLHRVGVLAAELTHALATAERDEIGQERYNAIVNSPNDRDNAGDEIIRSFQLAACEPDEWLWWYENITEGQHSDENAGAELIHSHGWGRDIMNGVREYLKGIGVEVE